VTVQENMTKERGRNCRSASLIDTSNGPPAYIGRSFLSQATILDAMSG
jgi:hypothetical protein